MSILASAHDTADGIVCTRCNPTATGAPVYDIEVAMNCIRCSGMVATAPDFMLDGPDPDSCRDCGMGLKQPTASGRCSTCEPGASRVDDLRQELADVVRSMWSLQYGTSAFSDAYHRAMRIKQTLTRLTGVPS
ncbi:MAG: hypothetical protein ACT4PE_05455 [Candidatus Eiseniibacteriota bacterium]